MQLLIIHPYDIEIALKLILGMSTLILTWYLIYKMNKEERTQYKIRYKYQNQAIKRNKK